MLVIRLMTDADIPSVTALESELFTSASWTASMLHQELHGPDRHYYVWTGELPVETIPNPIVADHQVSKGLEVLGYGGIWIGGPDAEIMTLGVAKKAQRRGIGKTLLQQLISTAREKKCARILLEVRIDNIPARLLYESVGFMPMGLRKHYYQPENIDALTMSLNL